MSQGRGSALVFLLMLFMMSSEMVQAATFIVGDSGGWTFNVENWPNGKRFRVGDILVFKYDPKIHNLVIVNFDGYKKCTTPHGSKIFNTGNDKVKLVKGRNNFICSIPGHCEAAMKITVTAT